MNRTSLTVLITLLAFFGLADAWYLTTSAVTDTALSCDLGAALDGCNVVAQSVYSKVFGIPLAAFGVLFYSLIFVLAGLMFLFRSPLLDRVLFWVASLGAIFSVIFLSIQFAFIKAICIYCIASAIAAFMIWGIARRFVRRSSPKHPEAH